MDSRMAVITGLALLGTAVPVQAQEAAHNRHARAAREAKQSGSPVDATSSGPRGRLRVFAQRLAGTALRMDGRLDDDGWRNARWVSDFTQKEPVEGAVPSERTEVAFLYDDEALYVGARMHTDGTEPVRALVTRRDVEGSSEQLVVSLDSYHDRRTAYSFGVTAAGVRLDYIHPSDKQSSRDYTYEPVWEARTEVQADGWTAELRIPFSQLRFHRCVAPPVDSGAVLAGDTAGAVPAAGAPDTATPPCSWGVNVTRSIPARNEEDYLVLVRRRETGWASRFADLAGIEEEHPPRRVEVIPYVTTEAKMLGDVNARNPFDHRREVTPKAGADIKLGLGSALTLDATVNPDFAQVEADPAQVNLTAFETVFPEHRPFFVEGSQLLKAGGLTWFQSRRIGQAPRLKAGGDYSESVTSTTIVGAAKVSGRLASGLSVGILSAVTGPEQARTYTSSTSSYDRSTIEPRTGFGVVRLQQELGRSGSTAGIIFTDVQRDLSGLPAARDVLPTHAYAGAADWYLRTPGKTYALSGAVGFSQVAGDSLAMLRIQTSSAHYFQRPDARTARVDSSRTSLWGTYAGSTLEKIAGSWIWTVSGYAQSPGLEINDAGKLNAANNWGGTGSLYYRQTKPQGWFHRWDLGTQSYQEWNYDGIRRTEYFSVFTDLMWKNFWGTGLSLGTNEPTLRDDLTRGGPLMGRPRELNVGVNVTGNPARKATWKIYGSLFRDEAGGWNTISGVTIAVRPGARWELSTDPSYSQGVYSRQYYTTLGSGPAATYGNRYVFAYLDHNEISTRLRVSYALTPDLTLETYAEPFASRGRYYRFGELPSPRSFALRTYGTDGSTLSRFGNDSIVVTDSASHFSLAPGDYTVLSFRSNVVLRWEWHAGSTAYLVWQQSRQSENSNGRYVGPSALWDALSTTGDNIVALKVSYWLSAR